MNKFVLATLAATAIVPVGAAAQTAHVNAHPNAGVTWRHHGGNQMMRHHGPSGGDRTFVIHRRGPHHGINRHPHYKRVDRGFFVPNHWWGPRFQIHNWGMYGFPQPLHGRRWVRYFDDALLIDHLGRVHDGRWGMNWDNYADEWAYDQEGIPYYGEDEDYYADEEGEDWEERGYARHHGPPPMPCPQACAYPGYGHGYGYGYGWMHGGMVTITETTVHAAAPQTVTETVYIEKSVKTKPRRIYKRAKPRPQPGERG